MRRLLSAARTHFSGRPGVPCVRTIGETVHDGGNRAPARAWLLVLHQNVRVDEVQRQVRQLICDWHGGSYGAFRSFWEEIRSQQDIAYKKLLDEIRKNGRVSWDVLALAVQICVPADDAGTRLELFAGLWQIHRGAAPPGYCGRIVVGDRVVRAALVSAADADDDRSRIALLVRERDLAEHALADHHRQITELQQELARLTTDLQRKVEDAEADRRGLIRSIELVSERMQQDVARQRAEGAELSARLDRLARENEALLARQEILARERDAAEDRAGRLLRERNEAEDRADQLILDRDAAEHRSRLSLRELDELKASAAEERKRLNQVIGDFETQVVALHRELDNARTGTSRGVLGGDDDGPFRPWDGRRQLPWVLDQGLPPEIPRRSLPPPAEEDGLGQAPYPD